MFQRLKGAIDSRIAEEQARQRAAQASSASSASPRSPSLARQSREARTSSPSRRSIRTKETLTADKNSGGGGNGNLAKGPDPAEFEKDLGDDTDEGLSRSGTPAPENEEEKGDKDSEGPELAKQTLSAARDDGGSSNSKMSASASSASSAKKAGDLPADVRVRLRKLDKLEGRYSDLLRSYQIAHGRVALIDRFETSLREHTPLTSISDPSAMIEYLNQIQLRGDMVLEELKRVTNDRDHVRQKLDVAERTSKEAVEALEKLPAADNSRVDDNTHTDQVPSTDENRPVGAATATDQLSQQIPPSTASEPQTPHQHETDVAQPGESSEDLFSYEDELPRLKSELQAREKQVEESEKRVHTLQSELAAARESAEGLVQDCEKATDQLQAIREQKDWQDRDSRERRLALERSAEDLQRQLSAAKAELQALDAKYKEELADSAKKQGSIDRLDSLIAENARLRATTGEQDKRVRTLNSLLDSLRTQLKEAETELESQRKARQGERTSHAEGADGPAQTPVRSRDGDESSTTAVEAATQMPPPSSSSMGLPGTASVRKKKPKKKRKAEKAGSEAKTPFEHLDVQTPNETSSGLNRKFGADPKQAEFGTSSSSAIDQLRQELSLVKADLEEKNDEIEKLQRKRKNQEDLEEEVESLRDDLLNVGQMYVESKERVERLDEEKRSLEKRQEMAEKRILELEGLESSGAASDQALLTLTGDFEVLQRTAATLKTDLSAAEQLAASRYKDLTTLKEALQKAQPELKGLRTEVADLRAIKEELDGQAQKVTWLEEKDGELSLEISQLRRQLSEGEIEIQRLRGRVKQEIESRRKTEVQLESARRDAKAVGDEKKRLEEESTKLSKDLTELQRELKLQRQEVRTRAHRADELQRDLDGFREEMELKMAQHASAQSLMTSMRDQTSELSMQMKEACGRAENLEEELADAHRILSERSRESETLRRLLADVQSRSETTVGDLRAQLDTALKDADRAEEEASVLGRRRAREVEELKTKARNAEKELRLVEEDREGLLTAQREWKRKREDLDEELDRSAGELRQARSAMDELRDALDESERQARELERQKADLRRSLEDCQTRLDKLQASQKDASEGLQSSTMGQLNAETSLGRSSLESTPSRGRIDSPSVRRHPSPRHQANGSIGSGGGSIDYVYLKNVLLQFLEQKDKKHQMQLVPVLGMLLHFDGKDEQKWMSAITTK